MQIRDITQYLESIAPLALQEQYDNCGLLIGNPEGEVSKALISLDVTPEIIEEAIEQRCQLIIAHHPLIFRGLKKLSGNSFVEQAVIRAIKHDIAVYAIHTNLDNILRNGVNDEIAHKLGLQDTRILSPVVTNGEYDRGAGIIGYLPAAMGEKEFLAYLGERMELKMIRHTRLLGGKVKKVAVCGGSGSFLLSKAIAGGAQFFVSADFKYHDFFEANDMIVIADIGHFESERFTIDLLGRLIRTNFPTFAVHLTTTVTNPITYYPL